MGRDDAVKLTQAQAAALLGVSTRRIRQRSQEENAPPQDEAGQYPCWEFGEWMLADFRRGLGIAKDGTVYDYDMERARLTHHQANSASLEEDAKRGRLIPADVVKSTWCDLVASARARLLSLPSRIASACSGKGAAEIETEARGIVYEALNELAGGEDAGTR